MDENITRDHYDRLAASYDENWAHSPAFLEWMNGCIQQRLRVGQGDLAIDIGCGTGLYARGLARYAAAVVCAEPSEPMLAQVPSSETLIRVHAGAEQIAGEQVALPYAVYDAMLLKEVLHHVQDRAPVITGLRRLLRPGGRMLVVMLPTATSSPLFAAARELFAAQQPDPADIASYMRTAGLDTDLSYESFPLTFSTERYLQMVRNRYMSLLAHFSDAQLETGIEEIRRAYPGEQVEFADTYAFVLGTAP